MTMHYSERDKKIIAEKLHQELEKALEQPKPLAKEERERLWRLLVQAAVR